MADDEPQQTASDSGSNEPESLPSEPDPRLASWFERGAPQDDEERR